MGEFTSMCQIANSIRRRNYDSFGVAHRWKERDPTDLSDEDSTWNINDTC